MSAARDRLIEKITMELEATIEKALADDLVTEILRNEDGLIWVDRHDTGMCVAGNMSDANALALIGSIAHSLNAEVNFNSPIVEGELLIDGSRFEALVPPVVKSPVFTIRKRARRVFGLDEYVDQSIITIEQRDRLSRAIRERRNIVIAGGTGSGKTTFANALIVSISDECPTDRLVIIEDTAEIQCRAQNAVMLHTTETVSMQALLRASMRLRPDRIMVGEVRGAEALDLLKAWNTGHPGGIGTVHASDVPGTLLRLEQLVGEAGTHHHAREIISQTVDIVAVLEGKQSKRRLSHLAEIDIPESATKWSYREL